MHLSDYEKQKVLVRIGRWLRHRPLSILNFVRNVLWFVFVKDLMLTTIEERFYKNCRGYVKHLWIVNKSLAQARMGDSITTEQLLENIKERERQ